MGDQFAAAELQLLSYPNRGRARYALGAARRTAGRGGPTERRAPCARDEDARRRAGSYRGIPIAYRLAAFGRARHNGALHRLDLYTLGYRLGLDPGRRHTDRLVLADEEAGRGASPGRS